MAKRGGLAGLLTAAARERKAAETAAAAGADTTSPSAAAGNEEAGLLVAEESKQNPLRAAATPSSSTPIGMTRGTPGSPQSGGMPAATAVGAKKSRVSVPLANLTQMDSLPLRALLQGLYRVKRGKVLIQATIFIVWFAAFLAALYGVFNPHEAFIADSALYYEFLDQELPGAVYKKNFNELDNLGDVYDFISGPLLEGLWPTQWYNGQAYTPGELGNVVHFARLVGPVQFRLARVGKNSCFLRRFMSLCDNTTTPANCPYDTKDHTCFSEFNEDTMDKLPFTGASGYTYVWRDGMSGMPGLNGYGTDYGTGGYVVEINNTRAAAEAMIAQLQGDSFLDRHTRALAINFNLYNTNTRMLSVCRILFEVFPAATLVSSYKFWSFQVVLYNSLSDKMRAIAEAVFLIGMIYHVQKEFRQMLRFKPYAAYFARPSNMFDMLVMGVSIWVAFLWVSNVLSKQRTGFDVNNTAYVDLYDFADNFMEMLSWGGLLCLLFCFSLFRFLGISRQMNTMWLTLEKAAPDLVGFVVAMAVLVAGFAFMAQMLFGYYLQDFHNFASSFSSLTRFVLGDFKYQDLTTARPALAGVFFGMYMAIVFMLVANMFIAIVTKYFEIVRAGLQRGEGWKEDIPAVHSRMQRRCVRVGQKLSLLCSRNSSQPRYARRTQKGPATTVAASERFDQPGESAKAREGRRQRQDAVQADWYRAEDSFLKVLRTGSHSMSILHNLDMLMYFEKVYGEEENSHTVFIGVHELCCLTQMYPCKHEAHVGCLARQILDAYRKMCTVLMVGSSRMHLSAAAGLGSGASQSTNAGKCFAVTKTNVNGKRQFRYLILDDVTGTLLNFNTFMILRKRLPLKQLIQVERHTTDDRRVDLVFTADGYEARSDAQVTERNDMETTYRLLFASHDIREDFLTKMLALKLAINPPEHIGASPEEIKLSVLVARLNKLVVPARQNVL